MKEINVDTGRGITKTGNPKELHIYLSHPSIRVCETYLDTKNAIESGMHVVHTTQIHFCSTAMIYDYDYHIIIHFPKNKFVIINKKGFHGDSDREMRQGLNLEHLLLSGEFGDLNKGRCE